MPIVDGVFLDISIFRLTFFTLNERRESALSKSMRQESHRIHWQQWGKDPQSKRDLITRSAAVRLTDAATARDVIQLLGESLELFGNGALILVGTLHGMPPVTYQLVEYGEEASVVTVDPFHVVRTLQDGENPLQVRDLMLQDLEKKRQEIPLRKELSSIIAPKLQWFFIPDDPASQILKNLELDGYSTTLEDEVLEGEDHDEDYDYEHTEPEYPDPFDMPWRVKDNIVNRSSRAPHEAEDHSSNQLQRSQQLAHQHNAADHLVVSGFLWKQSQIDPHVWRKVYCVVTEDHFWFVARVKKRTKTQDAAPYYGRIALSRALVVEASSSLSSRIPFSWEVVTASGRSHVFRAVSGPLQDRWTGCLKARIVQCHENRLFHQAELIVADETKARTKRLVRLMGVSSANNVELMKWTFLVFEYREQCRHIQHRLPAKALVVARSSSVCSSEESSSSMELPELDVGLRDAVRAVWDLAASLLLQAATKLLRAKGRNAETLCRHIDYILTGRMRLITEAGTPVDDELVNKSREPPPSNLFDGLLVEFQRKATVN